MPVPSSIDELSITPAENSPPGSEAVFPMLDDYLRTHAAFIAQTKLVAENAKKRANHTGTQAIETVEGLEEALAEALDKRVAKSSGTGVMYVPEGADAQRPLAADIPAGVAAVRGNSTSLTDRFLEFWNRATNTWDAIASRKWVTDVIAKLFSPSITGSAVLTGANNKLVLAGVVTELGLEKGDVIQIAGAGEINAKLRTIESIVNNGELILNYEHCAARGNGPLKLQNFTGAVTITRIAKWYSAADGLGQDWVNLSALRTIVAVYPNSTNRVISAAFSVNCNSQSTLNFNGYAINLYDGADGYSALAIDICPDNTYSISNRTNDSGWSFIERR